MMENTRPIRKLEEAVINRIAAGEVVQRPANALKELIENSLDAKSTNIQVTVKEGGLKLLQIQDNGTGIRKEDLNIVCERFTTSKLQKFEDLQSIATYGFRGEALASISHIAHITVMTKTADNKCAYQTSYSDGKPKGPSKPCAGNQGTLILVEDLYFNVLIRRKAFQNHATEYAKIAEVVCRYAIHNSTVGFSLKKHGNAVSDVKTLPNSTVVENIKLIFGAELAKELLDVSCESQAFNFKLSGFISSSNYCSKKTILILFINHRLVESTSIRKAIDAVYSAYLQKHKFPFLYLSVEIAPENVDVNVHPTKQEVHFLHESGIIETIQKTIEARLLRTSHSRTMYLQAILPTVDNVSIVSTTNEQNAEASASGSKTVYAHQMIRTDSRDQKLDAFMHNAGTQSDISEVQRNNEMRTTSDSQKITKENNSMTNVPKKREIKLQSVLTLLKDLENTCDPALRQIFCDHTFVGCVNRQYTLIQHQTKLYLMNTNKLSQQLFYQISIRDFGNFSVLKLSEPPLIHDLAMLALDSNSAGWMEESHGSKESIADYVVNMLKSKAEMLTDYFSLEIDQEGRLCSIPYLLENYFPALEGLPMFILCLATEVNWDIERECFETFFLVLSNFYAFPKSDIYSITSEEATVVTTQNNSNETTEMASTKSPSWKWITEHVLYAALRKVFQPPNKDKVNGTVLQIANLSDLYKVFERC